MLPLRFVTPVSLFVGTFDDGAERALARAYKIEGAKMAGAQLMLGQVYFYKKDYPKAIHHSGLI
ncbi:MAG TPA: hypothetical protein VLD57_05760 [Blastocatellia bacterium]|nr:hypothetical protein [Blastocatellia bacterium]